MFIPDPGSEFFPSRIRDTHFFHLGSRIRIKEFKYFKPKYGFKAPGNMIRVVHPGSGSRTRFLPIPDSGSMVQKGTGTRIRIRNTDRKEALGKGTFKKQMKKTSKMQTCRQPKPKHGTKRDSVTRGGGVRLTWHHHLGTVHGELRIRVRGKEHHLG